jgi:ArsR family transcriptional regulator
MDMTAYEPQARLFKVLMHPARLAILEILREGEECVCHMEAHLGYRQAYISQQLSVLKEAGLIQDRRDGWNIFYRVIRGEVYDILDTAYQMSGVTKGRHQIKDRVHDCPCPKCNIRRKVTGKIHGLAGKLFMIQECLMSV